MFITNAAAGLLSHHRAILVQRVLTEEDLRPDDASSIRRPRFAQTGTVHYALWRGHMFVAGLCALGRAVLVAAFAGRALASARRSRQTAADQFTQLHDVTVQKTVIV